jgi:hypothetical protein
VASWQAVRSGRYRNADLEQHDEIDVDIALLQVVSLEAQCWAVVVADCLGDLLEAVAPAATSATVAPSAASARAVSAPMPLLAAVMSATVFSRRLCVRL